KIFIEMDGLKDSKMGMFEPNQEMVLIYPIVADNLTPEDEFVSDVEWRANTLPRGEPIIIKEEGEEVKIAVVHRRLKIYRGKKILATGDENVFEVVLKVRNNGNFAVANYEFQDRIPKNFTAEELSLEPSDEKKDSGKKILTWTIESLDVDETIEIKYLLKPTGDKAAASDAQFSM
ncbi:MAG: COG1470 family protein, partial [Promethearchaeota archaeon]